MPETRESAALESGLPMVSVLVPCRNEIRYIGICLGSILENDYPKHLLEIIVIDGMSDDGSRGEIESYSQRFNQLRLIDNERKITPAALNLGIAVARGDVIIWMSSHNRYDSNYISLSVKYLMESGADNVGGVMVTLPRENTLLGRSISACLGNRFGVGNSSFRVHPAKPVWVDTVFGGCYRREVFRKIGLFNEGLVRGQDLELNLRLKKAGGKILLVPSIKSYYYARSDIRSFLRHNWSNGVWAILPFLYSSVVPVSLRHLVPLAFVLGVIALGTGSLIVPSLKWAFWAVLGAYGLFNVLATLQVVVKRRDIRFLFTMPVVFFTLHIGYGLGSLAGVFKGLKTVMGKGIHHENPIKKKC